MTQDITLDVAGARVTLPAATLTNLWLERVRGEKRPVPLSLPKIGFAFPDVPGIYAGLVVGDDKFGRSVMMNDFAPLCSLPEKLTGL